MHHCIQGWSGIAEWRGLSLRKLIAHVKPKPEARALAFYSYGESLYGGLYYDTQSISNASFGIAMHALDRHGPPWTSSYGPPRRLRVRRRPGDTSRRWRRGPACGAPGAMPGRCGSACSGRPGSANAAGSAHRGASSVARARPTGATGRAFSFTARAATGRKATSCWPASSPISDRPQVWWRSAVAASSTGP